MKRVEIIVTTGTYDSTTCGWKYQYIENEEKQLQPLFAIKTHSGPVYCSFPKNSYVYSGGHDEKIVIFDIKKMIQAGLISVLEGSIHSIFIFGNYIFVGTSLGSFICYEHNKHFDKIMNVQAHKGKILAISIHPSGKAALTVGDDRKLKLWNLSTGNCDFATRMRTVCDIISWSPLGYTFGVVKQKELMIYYSNSLEVVSILSHEKNITCFIYLTEELLLTGSESKALFLWDISSNELLYKIEDVHTSRIKGFSKLEIDPINEEFIVGSVDSDGGLAMWKINPNSVTLLDYQKVDVRFTTISLSSPGISKNLKQFIKFSKKLEKKEEGKKIKEEKESKEENQEKDQEEIEENQEEVEEEQEENQEEEQKENQEEEQKEEIEEEQEEIEEEQKEEIEEEQEE